MGRIDLSGRRYGCLTVTSFAYNNRVGKNVWECVCDCGNPLLVLGSHLKNGMAAHCGCGMKRTVREYAPVRVGQKVRFDPFDAFTGFGALDNKGSYITGTVVYVNSRHTWFSVEYGNPKLRTSYKFSEIGQVVDVIG